MFALGNLKMPCPGIIQGTLQCVRPHTLLGDAGPVVLRPGFGRSRSAFYTDGIPPRSFVDPSRQEPSKDCFGSVALYRLLSRSGLLRIRSVPWRRAHRLPRQWLRQRQEQNCRGTYSAANREACCCLLHTPELSDRRSRAGCCPDPPRGPAAAVARCRLLLPTQQALILLLTRAVL